MPFVWFILQLHVRKCNECGQPLPESYQAPADEPWTTGICDCAEDAESCKFYSWVTDREAQFVKSNNQL